MKKNILILLAAMIATAIWGTFIMVNYGHADFALSEAETSVYLYPEEKTDVTVELAKDPKVSYPYYQGWWFVSAEKDGRLKEAGQEREYGQLFSAASWNDVQFSKNEAEYCVKKEQYAEFLESKLKEFGLTEKEANDFIIRWLPRMDKYPCCDIRFVTGADIPQTEDLIVSPEPDTVMRLWMLWAGTSEVHDTAMGGILPTARKGFTVVECTGIEFQPDLKGQLPRT